MLHATGNIKVSCHVGGQEAKIQLNCYYNKIEEIQADGDELVKCCQILGRDLPPISVYKFLGNNAKEIAANW